MKYETQKFESIVDDRGNLTVCENIPFDIKRIFWIDNLKTSSARGDHAHLKCKQYFICLAGRILIALQNKKYNDGEIKFFHLEKNEGVYIPEKTWDIYSPYTEDCIGLVCCSEKYDPNDYINDYELFNKLS